MPETDHLAAFHRNFRNSHSLFARYVGQQLWCYLFELKTSRKAQAVCVYMSTLPEIKVGDGILPCRFGVSFCRFGVLPCRFGVFLRRFGVLPCRFGVSFCRFGVLPCRFGVSFCSFGVLPCRFGTLTFSSLCNPRFGPLSNSVGIVHPMTKIYHF